ncbi:cell division protein FtsQ/DivIB [Enterococcus nangangensis]
MGIFDPEHYQKKSQEKKPTAGDDVPKTLQVVPEVPSKETPETATSEPKIKTLPKKDSFADKLPNLHKARQKKLRRQLFLLISLFVVIIAGTSYFLSPFSKLGKVTITGNQVVPTDTVLTASKLEVHAELWPQVFRLGQAEKEIVASNPRIKSATVAFQPVNQVTIKVTEYQEKAYLLKEKLYYPILENGVVLTTSQSKPSEDFPILENFTDEKLILATLEQYRQLSQELQQAISEIKSTATTSDRQQLTLMMNDGNTVIAQVDTLAQNLAKYPQVAKEMTASGVVDMEVGIFTYPYPETGTTATTSTTESSNP